MFILMSTRTPAPFLPSEWSSPCTYWWLGAVPPHGKDSALPLAPSTYHSEAQLCMWDNSWLLSAAEQKVASPGHSTDHLGPATGRAASAEARLWSAHKWPVILDPMLAICPSRAHFTVCTVSASPHLKLQMHWIARLCFWKLTLSCTKHHHSRGWGTKAHWRGSAGGWENAGLSFSPSTPLLLNWNIRYRKEEKAALCFSLTPKPHSLPYNWLNSTIFFARACYLHTIRLMHTRARRTGVLIKPGS